MQPVIFSNLFDSYKQIDFFLNTENEQDLASTKFYLCESNSSENIVKIFNYLYEILGLTDELKPSNYASVLFDADSYEHKYTAYPMVAINSSQELVLRIGATSKSDDHHGVDIPLLYDGEAYYLQHPDSQKKLVLDLHQMVMNAGTTDQKIIYYIVGKASRPKYQFFIPFRVQENTSSELISEAWYNGQFHLICSSFNRAGANLTKMFAKTHYERGEFPSEGVLLVLRNGSYREFEYEKKKIISSNWTIVASSHPNLVVTSYSDGEVPLSSVGNFSCSSACDASKFLITNRNEAIKKGMNVSNFSIPLYFLHVVRPNQREEWQFVNIGFVSLNTLSPLVRRNFAMFIAEIKAKLASDNQQQLPASNASEAVINTSVKPVAEKEKVSVAKDDTAIIGGGWFLNDDNQSKTASNIDVVPF